jgi:multiple sugar transport system permease protein
MKSTIQAISLSRRIDWRAAALFGPFATLVLFAFALPLAAAIRSSFQIDEFMGRAGYAVLFEDALFRSAVYRTVRFALLLTPIQVALAWLAAGFLVRRMPLSVFVGGLSVPASVSPPAAALLWRLLLDPSNGMAAELVSWHPSIDWTQSPVAAQVFVALIDTWQWLPILTLLFGLWLYRLDNRLVAMASLDGSGQWRLAWRIILRPMLPFVWILAAFRFADLIRVFDIPFVLTGGGPGSVTEFISIYSYRYSLEFFRPVIGTAAGVVAFLLAFVPNVFVVLWSRREKST